MSHVWLGNYEEGPPIELADLGALNHALVPWLGSPVVLRLVDSRNKALNYAAGGFHVAVARGLAGGCKSKAGTISPTSASTCADPLGRADVRAMWQKAASAYLGAYKGLTAGGTLSAAITALKAANNVADSAYRLEGVSPPRDPGTGTVEPPLEMASQAGWGTWLAVVALAAGAWWFVNSGAKKSVVKSIRGGGKRRAKRLGGRGRILQKVAPLKRRRLALPKGR